MEKRKRKYEANSEAENLFKPEWFRMPAGLSLKKLRTGTGTHNRSHAKIQEYVNSKKEGEHVRRQLLKLVKSDKTDTDTYELPNSEERSLIKYHYYIHQGIDTINIAPIQNLWLTNILERIPPKLRKKSRLTEMLILQVKEDFLLTVKKSIIDFALQDCENLKYRYFGLRKMAEKESLEEIKMKQRSFELIKLRIQKNLFRVHPTIVKISQLWSLQYRNMRIVNVKDLYQSEALELNQFSEWISSQIELCKNIILEKWIPWVFKILSNVMEKKHFAVIKEKKLNKFYECLSTLMSLQLQTLCYKTITEYTNFICDVERSPGFQVHVLYKNNKIIFNPSYKDFKKVYLSAFEKMMAAVTEIPRIETKLYVSSLNDPKKFYLNPLILPEIIESCRTRIEETLQDEWICPELKIQDFDDYVCLINGQSRIEVNKLLSDERSFNLYKEKVSYYHDLGIEISLLCSKVETIASFEIHREHFISILINKSQATKDRFLTKITDMYQDTCRCLNEEFQDIKDILLKPPVNTAELVQLKMYSLKLGTEVFFEMEDRLRETMNYILFFSDYIPLNSSQIKQNSVTFLWYRRINSILEESRNIIKEKTKVFQDLLLNRIETFKNNLELYQKEVDEFQNYRDASELSKYLKKAQHLYKKFNAARERIREFNEEEEAFGWMKTFYPKRDELVDKLSPYKKLYENCADYKNKYQVWTEANVGTYDPEQIEQEVQTFHCNVIELSKEFSSNPAPYALTNSIKLEVEQFQKHMPIVKTLGNTCLKDRHWEKITEIVGFPLRVGGEVTLAKILEKRQSLEEFIAKFQLLSDSASKENDLEMKLNHMVEEWKDVKFEIAPYRDSGTFILTTSDEIQILLDDHIVKTQTMKNSPYIKPFESTIHIWEEKLILLQEIIDCWLLVQRSWIYLEPIFTFSDIQHFIPEESKRFNAVDKIWKDIMKATSQNTTVLAVINIEKMLDRLGKCNTLLNMIQNGLTGFLETKRSSFPRFYFISDSEILNIMSNSRDPKEVQPYLKKCFPGIEKLRFNEDGDVTSLVSHLGEVLNLNEIVDTGSKRGQIEKWLGDLERVMKNSVKQEIKSALVDYGKGFHKEWIDLWTQQALLMVIGAITTKELTHRLDNTASLKLFLAECKENIKLIIGFLNEKTKMKSRYVLVSLIITFMQIQDQLSALIAKPELQRRTELSMHIQHHVEDENIKLSVLDYSIAYGCEYMGNFIPLIMTPSSDSCYKFIFTSHKYHYGVCLEGAPATGKTEMIKDFARKLAQHYIIFSCSTIMDHSIIEMIFKGIASSDIWFCFDNIDIVGAATLRIIEYHVTRIQQAIQFGDRHIKSTGMNGVNMEFHSNQLTFATASSRYFQDHYKLPSLLQSYFRCFKLNLKERKKIIRTKFILIGFKNYEMLAEKLETLFKITAELFESKNSLCNDLRILDVVLKNIMGVKESRTSQDEEHILSNAVESVFRPLFYAEDWILFKKILTLTFNGLNTVSLDETLSNAVREACKRENVVFDGNIFDKVHQLLNALKHSTGVVLVGETFGGKSTILRIMSTVLQSCSYKEELETVVINPKSVTVKQLFGRQDEGTKKWIDGIFSMYYRQFYESTNNARKLLIFDGPMDSSWTENLNSILDNSKKLYLESGESIPLGKRTHLIFETANLDNVSPLTVSRCSIITVNSNLIKWEYLISSWLNTLPSLLSEHHKNHIYSMALRFCRPLFYLIDNVCDKMVYSVTKNNMIKSLCDIFDCFMDDYRNENYMLSNSEIDIRSQLEGIFLFSCIWSLGALLNNKDKLNFDTLIRALQCKHFPVDVQKRLQLPDELCRSPSKQHIYVIPDLATVFDYQYIKEGKGRWKLWSDGTVLTSTIARELQFHQIVVPTKATIRNQHLISLLASKQKMILFVGDTASGKTTDVKYFMNTKLDTNLYKPVFLNFTAGTTSNSIQHLISCKLNKRKKCVYGPPLGLRYILFIDDLNAAEVDRYGVNSAIELLRHWIEFGQWFNLDNSSVVRLIEIQLLCAMTTKSNSSRQISLCPRFTKYFTIINNDTFDNETLKCIFSKIMLWHLDTRGFSKEFDPCIEQIVDATLAIHRRVQKRLLPVPQKSHYIFNLRDFSKIIQGVVLSVPEAVEDLSTMKRLWVHEVTRIYHDRIIDKCDSDWFMDNLRDVTQSELIEDLDNLLQHLTHVSSPQVCQHHMRKLIFCDFINPKADLRNYAEVQDLEGLQSIVEGYLTEYNNVNKQPLNLLLFSYAIEHLSRICRIIKQPQGHALLLGEYGSGKQSLARLAIHMCEYEFFEIELSNSYNESDWREDMKNLLFSVYTNQHSAFLCTNIEALTMPMLEDISNLLQYAQIPEIFTTEDKKEIYEKMEFIDNQRDKALQTDGSHEALFDLFLQRIKKQIHIVLVVNLPIYDFRKYMHKFPSFFNCCTIDWFEPWPEETQNIVARKLLHDVKCEYHNLQLVIELCIKIHHSAKKLAAKINSKCGIKICCTQKSFMRLVTTFRNLFIKKENELTTSINLYERVLQRLSSTKEQIPILEDEHQTLQPLIHNKRIQVETLESTIEGDREAETEAEISLNGAKTMFKNSEKKLNIRKLEYDNKLKELGEVRENVLENLQLLTTNDLAVLKSMKSPPKPVKLVAEGLVYIKELKAEKIQESGRIVEDFWKPAVKLISDSKFIDILVNFNMSEVSARVFHLLEKVISHGDFDSEKIKSYSTAAEVIFRWLSLVYEFNKVTKMDSQVRVNLTTAEEEYEKAKSNVAEKERLLEKARNKRENFLNQLDQVKDELSSLEKRDAITSKKQTRAAELLQILDKKKESWIEEKQKAEKKYETLIGDVLLCSAVLTYFTSLSHKFRDQNIQELHSIIRSSNLSCCANFTVSESLLSEMEIQEVQLTAVVEDEYLNHILAITRNSSRYPLLIDPHGLMTSWMKTVEHGNEIIIIRSNHQDCLRNLDNAITSGSPVLLEQVSEKLDPLLYSVFERQTFKTPTGIHVKFGKNSVEYNPNFKMYLSCEIQDPQFNLEIYEKLMVVNCILSKSSIEKYLLKTIIKKDRPDLETLRHQSAVELLKLKRLSAGCELNILNILSEVENILEAEAELSRVATDAMVIEENAQKIADINAQLETIYDAIFENRGCAKFLADLFEILENLRHLNPLYQFSLKWYKNIILTTIERLEKTEKTDKRLNLLTEIFVGELYSLVSHSLVEQDKLVFAYLLATHTVKQKQQCSYNELEFCIDFLRKHVEGSDVKLDKDKLFRENLSYLDELSSLKGVKKNIEKSIDDWMQSPKEDFELPYGWQEKLNNFQIMLLRNCMSSENILNNIMKFTEAELNKPLDSTANLSSIYKELRCYVPISIVVFNDSDPTRQLFSLAVSMGISSEKCHVLTTVNEFNDLFTFKNLESAKAFGCWIIIRNLQWNSRCFDEVENIFEALSPSTVHPDFRLWIILQSDLDCPEFILRNSFIVAWQCSGIEDSELIRLELCKRLNLKEKGISKMDDYYFKNLTIFHKMLVDFTNNLPLNGVSEFDATDFQIAFNEIRCLGFERERVDVERIYAIFQHCCYESKITNKWDTRYLINLRRNIWNEEVMTKFSYSSDVQIINLDWLITFLPSLRAVNDEMMKLKKTKETQLFIRRLLKVHERDVIYDKKLENTMEIIEKILSSIPDKLKAKARIKGTPPKDIFITAALTNEVEHFNSFASNVRFNLLTLKESLKGYVPLTDDFENILNALNQGLIRVDTSGNRVQSKAFVIDIENFSNFMARKYNFLNKWLQDEIEEYDLAALEWPKKFFILHLLQHCLKENLSSSVYEFDSYTMETSNSSYQIRVHNLLIQNARLNSDTNQLVESGLNTSQELPTLTLTPCVHELPKDTQDALYACPTYQKQNNSNEGDGCQKDFLISIAMPSQQPPQKWIQRRVNSITKNLK